MFDKLDDLLIRYEEIMSELGEPGTADDQDRFRRLMKESSDLAPIVEAYNEYKKSKQNISDSLEMLEGESDDEMREMLKEELASSKERLTQLEDKLKILLLPKDPNDDKNVIVEIRAGAGGDEAALFAAEIYRMYVHYAEGRGWKVEMMEADEIGIGGMKSVSFMITGQGAYSVMKYESGVHRVQRVPETESGGRIHTSTISVAVMPEAEDVDVVIDEKDIRIDVMRASGNGGQCVNTTDSAVRLTHYPTGIVIYSQAFGYAQLYTAPRQLGFIASSAILIGGATVSKAKVSHVLIGVFLFEGVLVFGQQIANAAVSGGGLSEVMRIMISNGIILYALTQSGGGKRD